MNRHHAVTFTTITLAVLAATSLLSAAGRSGADERSLFMDVHRLGPGGVTAEAVAEAHRKDLEVQGEFDVDYQRYWVDEREGNVYCLVRAPSAESADEVHSRAHGLRADRIVEVEPGILPAAPQGDRRLFMDTHLAGPGTIHAEDVAEAHRKDLAVQDAFDVSFLEYWVDEESGTVHCLAEAPAADALRATHGEAHGLLPDEVHEVVSGQ